MSLCMLACKCTLKKNTLKKFKNLSEHKLQQQQQNTEQSSYLPGCSPCWSWDCPLTEWPDWNNQSWWGQWPSGQTVMGPTGSSAAPTPGSPGSRSPGGDQSWHQPRWGSSVDCRRVCATEGSRMRRICDVASHFYQFSGSQLCKVRHTCSKQY